MKKIFYLALAAFAFASCNKEVTPSVVEEVAVSVTVNMPGEVSTKAIADGLTATKLYYEVWSADKDTRFYKGTANLTKRKTKVEFNLVKNQTYNILFWAQDPNAAFYGADDEDGLSVITMNYSPVGTATGVVYKPQRPCRHRSSCQKSEPSGASPCLPWGRARRGRCAPARP